MLQTSSSSSSFCFLCSCGGGSVSLCLDKCPQLITATENTGTVPGRMGTRWSSESATLCGIRLSQFVSFFTRSVIYGPLPVLH